MPDPANPPRPVSLLQRVLVGRHPKRTLVRAVVLAIGAALLFGYVLVPVRIKGVSMEPTCRDGGCNLINRPAYLLRAPRRGDVEAVGTTGRSLLYCKRFVALPGETIAIRQGTVLIDGRPLAEPYVKDREPWEVAPVQLGGHEYFVIGDNRGMDQDSHVFGRVARRKLLGPTLW
jgi:signal peptidase I